MKCWLKIESDYQQDKYAPHYGKTPQPGPTYFMSHWTYYVGGIICQSLGDATGSTKTSRNVVYIRSQFMGDKCLKRSKDADDTATQVLHFLTGASGSGYEPSEYRTGYDAEGKTA